MLAVVFVLVVPTVLQAVGWAPPSYEFDGQRMSVLPWAIEIGDPRSLWLLLIATAATILVPMILMGRWVDNLSKAERKIFAQAWNLKRWLGGGFFDEERIEPGPDGASQSNNEDHV